MAHEPKAVRPLIERLSDHADRVLEQNHKAYAMWLELNAWPASVSDDPVPLSPPEVFGPKLQAGEG